MEGPGIDILTRAIGAENVDLTLIDAKQMSAEVHPEEGVFIALREQNHVATGFPVDLCHPAKVGLDRTASFVGVDERSKGKAIFIPKLWNLRRAILIVLIAARNRRIIGRQERCEEPPHN